MMADKSHPIKNNHITTDDLAFSAYLKMKDYPLIESNKIKSKGKSTFTFVIKDVDNIGVLELEFINSDFLVYYNEIRNLKKLI